MPHVDRCRVAYVMKMYPRLAETFILNEILAHEAVGLPMDIFSLRSPVDGRYHAELGRVSANVTYLSGASVKTDPYWEALCRAQGEYGGCAELLAEDPPEEASNIYQGILLADAVRKRGIRHVHAHFATAAASVARVASRLTGVPYSFTAHAKDIYHESVQEPDLRRKLRDAAAVVTVSDYNRTWLRERFGDDAARVERVYNGLDLDEFTYEAPDDRSPLIVAVGRLVDKKGFTDLVAACRILADRGQEFHCEIIGSGVQFDELSEQIERLDMSGRVSMLGPRSRDEVVTRIRRAAVMAAPCVISQSGNRDGMPTVLLEAMALGTPCVSTDVTGIPELVRHEDTGLLARQNDPASLADALTRMLVDGTLRVELAGRARRLIEQDYDIGRNTTHLRQLFTSPTARNAPVEIEVA